MISKPLKHLLSSHILILLFVFLGSGCLKFSADEVDTSLSGNSVSGEAVDELEDHVMVGEFDDGRYNLSFIRTVTVDVSEHLAKHPDATSVRVANGSGSSIDVSFGENLETVYEVIDDGQGITTTIVTTAGYEYDYSL